MYAELEAGINYQQVIEVLERFSSGLQATPTVAHQMGLSDTAVGGVLDGKVWPQARQHWLDNAVVVV